MAGVSVEKRGSTWRYRFDAAKVGGKRTRVQKGGFATKREAQAAGAAALAEYNNCGLVFKPNEISYADYLDYWMEEYCKVNLKAGTVNTYKESIENYIKPRFGAYRLPQLASATLQSAINEMFNSGYAISTIKGVRGVLRKSLEYAVETARFTRDNPALSVRLPRYNAQPSTPTRRNPHIYVKKEDADRLFELYQERSNSHIPLLLGYRCGMRKGEIYGLEVGDIDFANKKISIRQQMQKDLILKRWYITAPKYNSSRIIDVDEDTLAVLARRVQRIETTKRNSGADCPRYFLDGSGYIQTEETGREFLPLNVDAHGKMIMASAIVSSVSRIKKRLNLPDFDFHSLRHTHATMLAERGFSFKYIQERLGHKNVAMTIGTYQHVSPIIEATSVTSLNEMYCVQKEMPESGEESQPSGIVVPTDQGK